LASFWTATGEVLDQLEHLESAVEKSPNAGLALSGDIAADFYAPWRRPSRITAYIVLRS